MHAKKQHFVPQFYLKNFAHSKNKLWIYMRDSPRENRSIHEVNIRRACAENYLYEIPLRNSADSTFFEQGTTEAALSGIESLFAPSVKYFLEFSWCTPNKQPEELWKHADVVAAFAANLIVRNPKWIKRRRSFAPALTRQLQSNDFFKQNKLFELEKLGYSSNLESVVEFGIQHAELFYSNNQSSMMRLAEALLKMSFILLKSPADGEFVTSSFPVAASWSNESSKNPDWVYLPLGASSALMLHKEPKRRFCYNKLSAESTAKLNIFLLNSNTLWDMAIAKSKAALETCLPLLT